MDPAQTFGAAGPEISHLLGGGAALRVRRALEMLALPAKVLCLEHHLGEHAVGRTDLALCLAHPTPALAKALAALLKQRPSEASWQRCWQLVSQWATASEPTWAAVPFMFVAFDLPEEVDALPVPCLSLCTDPGFFMRAVGLPPLRPAPREWPLQLLQKCCSALGAEPIWDEAQRRGEDFLTSSDALEVRQLSLMVGRRPVAFKFDVTLPRRELPRFLEANGWSCDDARDVTGQLSAVGPVRERVQLNYAVQPSAAASKALELELGCTGATDLSAEERGELLERLLRDEVVTALQARALMDLCRDPCRSFDQGAVFRHWYLKLRLVVGQRATAKAYLGFRRAHREEGRDAANRG